MSDVNKLPADLSDGFATMLKTRDACIAELRRQCIDSSARCMELQSRIVEYQSEGLDFMLERNTLTAQIKAKDAIIAELREWGISGWLPHQTHLGQAAEVADAIIAKYHVPDTGKKVCKTCGGDGQIATCSACGWTGNSPRDIKVKYEKRADGTQSDPVIRCVCPKCADGLDDDEAIVMFEVHWADPCPDCQGSE